MKAQREIVDEVRGLTGDFRPAGQNISVAGRALVWDMRDDSRHKAHEMLRYSMRARSTDDVITVFMVVDVRNVKQGSFSISQGTAYSRVIDIAVVTWPDKEPVGFYSVISRPPATREARRGDSYGDKNKPVAQWIKGLLRD